MNLTSFVQNLQHSINKELPGRNAHIQLAPKGRYAETDSEVKNSVKSAVLILLFERNGEILIPVIQKTKYEGVHSGQVSLPGGKAEIYDKDIEQTALRETEEEIGIDQNTVKVIGKLSSLYIPVSNFEVIPVVGYIDYEPIFKLNYSEVECLYFLDIKEFINLKTTYEKVNVRETIFDAPFLMFKETKIWGATSMMLNEFKEVLKDFQQ